LRPLDYWTNDGAFEKRTHRFGQRALLKSRWIRTNERMHRFGQRALKSRWINDGAFDKRMHRIDLDSASIWTARTKKPMDYWTNNGAFDKRMHRFGQRDIGLHNDEHLRDRNRDHAFLIYARQ
jgi:hypothetical protein